LRIPHKNKFISSLLCFALWCVPMAAQTTAPKKSAAPKKKAAPDQPVSEPNIFKRIAGDQVAIWTLPKEVRARHLAWLIPASVVVGESLHRDQYMFDRIHFNGQGVRSRQFSDAGLAAFGGMAVGSYLVGRLAHNDHMRETGVLATEALTNAFIVDNALKYSLGRRRPLTTNAGEFFHPGGDSFPSGHAMYSWAVASVIAHEYPGWVTQASVYALATGVSLARVTGRKHFPTDVLVGSALGWGIGHVIYKRHHDPMLPGENIGNFVDPNQKHYGGSPYEPLDSWTYLAVERLAARGYIHSAFNGLKPWTRAEFARMIAEGDSNMESSSGEVAPEDLAALKQLKKDFSRELAELRDGPQTSVVLESAYLRFTGISGPPLNDGFHFGQTIYNDYGRPYGEGLSAVTGMSGSATYGRWAFYVRGEYQHAPSIPSPPLAAQNTAQIADQLPFTPLSARGEVNRGRLLDAYVSVNVHDWQVSLGKQSLNWSPALSGSMSYSQNADPVTMLRVSRSTPMYLPLFLKYLGPTRAEIFFGRLEGHRWIRTSTGFFGPVIRPAPFIHGEKLSFAPTKNFQFGVSVTTVFGGPGFPFTLRTVLRSFGFSNTNPGLPNDPGDRRAGFTLSYRLPKIRSVNFYLDQMTEDEISPIGYPRRSATNAGLFFSKLPGLPRTDLRVEGFFTDIPGLRQTGSYFANSRYLSGYTNEGNILGHPVGRDGTGVLAEARWWLTPKDPIAAFYRNSKVNPKLISFGGRLDDAGISGSYSLRSGVTMAAKIQYERWKFPVLANASKTNVATILEIRLNPVRLK
jgi:hypothetical protein